MKGFKRIIAGLLTLGLVVSSVGCGGGGKGAHELTGESISVVVQTNGLGTDWIEDVAERYTYDTGIVVNVQFDALLNSNLFTILSTDVMECADVYFGQTGDWADWLKNDLIVDLTDIYTDSSDGESLADRCVVQDYCVENVDGSKSYGMLPLSMGPIGMAYNVEMMNYLCHDVLGWEEGHDYPTTTAELREVMNALETTVKNGSNKELFSYESAGQTLDVKAWAWSGSIGTLEFLFKPWMQQYWGEEKMNEFYAQQSNPDMFNDEAFYVCYQEIMNLLELTEGSDGTISSANSVPNCLSYNHTESQTQFLLGHALLVPAGSWLYSESMDLMGDLENWGFMPVPTMTDDEGKALCAEGVTVPTDEKGNYVQYLGINTQDFMFVPTRSQKQDLAKDFLKYMYSEDSLATIEENIQAPVCFTCNDSEIELNGWAKQVQGYVDSAVKANTLCKTYSTNPMFGIGALNFVSDTLPYAKLSQGGYGSINKYYDSKTLNPIASPEEATGVAITENVYKYVQWNYNYKVSHWHEFKQRLGIL